MNEGKIYPLLSLSVLFAAEETQLTGVEEYQVMIDSEAGQYAIPAEQTFGIVYESKGQFAGSGAASGSSVVGDFCYMGLKFQVLDVDQIALSMT